MKKEVVSMKTNREGAEQLKGASQRGRRAEKSGMLDRFCQRRGLSRSLARRDLSFGTPVE